MTGRERMSMPWFMHESTWVVEQQTGRTNTAQEEDSIQTLPIPPCPWLTTGFGVVPQREGFLPYFTREPWLASRVCLVPSK